MCLFNRLFRLRIFKFRTTLAEELEDLHTESLNLEQSIKQTRLIQHKWTKVFAIYVALVYLVLNIAYFTIFLSNEFTSRLYSYTISILLGILLYGLHWIVRWYFRTVIHLKEDRLALFKDRKQELIEEVKNKETYTIAKKLLEKYDEQVTPESQLLSTDGGNRDLRQRISVRPVPPGSNRPPVTITSPNIGRLEMFDPQNRESRPAQDRTSDRSPREILPPQRTFWGLILDTIVGDGPSKRELIISWSFACCSLICDDRLHERWKFRFRFALICKSCNSHNGMALEEEFDYISFRCAYCNYYNRASKQKPVFQVADAVSSESQPITVKKVINQSEIEPIVETTNQPSSALLNFDEEYAISVTHHSLNTPTVEDTDDHQLPSTTTDYHSEYPLTSTSSKEDLRNE